MVGGVRPEAVSIGLRELDQPAIGEAGLADFFAWLAREKIMTQVILYDVKDVRRWQDLRTRGVIPDSRWSLLHRNSLRSSPSRSSTRASRSGPPNSAACDPSRPISSAVASMKPSASPTAANR